MFLCNYCGVEHDDDRHAREHVIPEAMLNKHLVLPDTCAYWNNYFARSFETIVTSASFTQEVLRYFDPARLKGKGRVYIQRVVTARGTVEHLWADDGASVLSDMPRRETSDTIVIDAFDGNDERQKIEVQLPFSYTVGASNFPKIEDELAKDRLRLLDYLKELADDPARNPALFEELTRRGLQLRPPKALSFEKNEVATTPGTLVDDVLPQLTVLPIEPWFGST